MAGLGNFFNRKQQSPAAPSGLEGADLTLNDGVERKQRILLLSGGSLVICAAVYWLFFTGPGVSEPDGLSNAPGAADVKVSTDDLAMRNMSEREWLAMSENRLTAQDNQLRRLQGQGDQMAQLQAQIDSLRAENANMASDGTRVVSAYEEENRSLREQLATAQSGSGAGPRALYGEGGPSSYQALPASAGAVLPSRGELKVINFGVAPGAAVSPPARTGDRSALVTNDSPNYLPANSYARARVIVGVDAASNVSSQSDPLPVVLRIVGPARSVARNGKVLTTRIEGCLVNGAARGDLSSEKVYVKLARMTCPQPGGRYAESEVKGFIAFGGKTGVRGRVVSREGSLTMQAFFAGLVGGVGRGFSANTNGFLNGVNIGVGGQRQQLSTDEIVQGGLGEGVAQAGDMLSQYLIERAEQYQPVIEMPTGVEVEIVFLEGVQIRN